MRKTIFVLIILMLCLIISFSYAYMTYNSNVRKVTSFNEEWESYQDKEIVGADIATIINKAVDNNQKYNIEKDNKGNYISEEQYSIKVDIYVTEAKKMYSMETIYRVGIEQFVNNFYSEKFKCTKIEYHQANKRVKYLLFEQVVQS